MTLDAGLSSATQRFAKVCDNFRWWDVRFNYTVRKFGRCAVGDILNLVAYRTI